MSRNTAQLQKLKNNKIYLTIGIFLVFILVVWVMFSITLTNTQDQIDPKIKKAAKPFSPIIDRSTFKELEVKKSYTDNELNNFTIYKLIFDKGARAERVVPIDFDETTLTPTPKPTTTPTPKLLVVPNLPEKSLPTTTIKPTQSIINQPSINQESENQASPPASTQE